MKSRIFLLLGIAGSVLIVASVFMPYFTVGAVSINGLRLLGFSAMLLITFGILIFGSSLQTARWAALINLVLGLWCIVLALQYQKDILVMHAVQGPGTWALILGGFMAAIAGLIRLANKNLTTPTFWW